MGPGGPRGLQIRRRRGFAGTGGFDSHTLPPSRRLRCARDLRLAAHRLAARPDAGSTASLAPCSLRLPGVGTTGLSARYQQQAWPGAEVQQVGEASGLWSRSSSTV